MSFTDQQIKDYALKMESKGAPPDKIRSFIGQAKSEQTGGAFKPKRGQVVKTTPQTSSFTPSVQPTFTGPENEKYGIDKFVWENMDEQGKETMRMNFDRLNARKRQELRNLNQRETSRHSMGLGEKALHNLGAWGASQTGALGKGVLNQLGALSSVGGKIGDFVTGGLTSNIRQKLGGQKDVGAPLKQAGQGFGDYMSKHGQEQFSQASPISRGIGSVSGTGLSMAPSMYGTGAATKLLRGAGKTGFLRNLGAITGGGTIGTAGATGAMEGRLPTAQEFATGGAIDAAMFGIGAPLRKLSSNAYNKLLGLTRTQKGKIAQRGMDLGEALGQKGYIGASRSKIAGKVGKDIGKMSNKLDDLIKRAEMGDTRGLTPFTADDLTKNVSANKIFRSRKLQPKFGELKTIKKQIQTSLDEFAEMMGNKQLSLSEVQNFKKKLGRSLTKYFARTGDAKATARELVNDALRKNAKEIIEANVSGARQLNKQMQPLIEAKDVLTQKGDYSGTLGDLILGGTVGAGAFASGQDPMNAIKYGVLAPLGKKALTSPLGRSLRGSMLSGASKAATSPVTRQAIKGTALDNIKNLLFGR
jgi:hypothetical protein